MFRRPVLHTRSFPYLSQGSPLTSYNSGNNPNIYLLVSGQFKIKACSEEFERIGMTVGHGSALFRRSSALGFPKKPCPVFLLKDPLKPRLAFQASDFKTLPLFCPLLPWLPVAPPPQGSPPSLLSTWERGRPLQDGGEGRPGSEYQHPKPCRKQPHLKPRVFIFPLQLPQTPAYSLPRSFRASPSPRAHISHISNKMVIKLQETNTCPIK